MNKNESKLLDKIFSNPITLIAVTYPYIIVVIVGLGLYFITNTNKMLQNAIPPKLHDSLSVIPELTVQEPRITSAVDLKALATPTPAMIEKGKLVFTNTCVSCHGAEGKGDGVAGAALNPKPRNFHVAEGWKNGRKISDVFKTLQFGIQGSGMSAFDFIPVEDRIAVISYIRTFMTDAPVDSPADIATLDNTYKLSLGTKQPGQIPVAAATQLLQKQFSGKSEIVVRAVNKVRSLSGSNSDAQLLLSVTSNLDRAFATLVNSSNWNSSKENFKNIVKLNLVQNGFSPRFDVLSDEEVSKLFEFLRNIVA